MFCFDEKAVSVSVWFQMSGLFWMCGFLSSGMRAWLCRVDKVLSFATAGISTEEVSAKLYTVHNS